MALSCLSPRLTSHAVRHSLGRIRLFPVEGHSLRAELPRQGFRRPRHQRQLAGLSGNPATRTRQHSGASNQQHLAKTFG